MIVKVQVSLDKPTAILIYNKHRDWTYQYFVKPHDPLLKLMAGRKKAYFYCTPERAKATRTSVHYVNSKGKRKAEYTLHIGNEACRQDW